MKHWESKENRVVTIAEVYKSSAWPRRRRRLQRDSVSLVKTFKTTPDDANYASASGDGGRGTRQPVGR